MIFARNPKEHTVLSTKHVTVIGCGSFGSAIAEMLVRAGVGQLTLIDPDTLSPENIGRHMLTQGDLGRPKADALRDRLLAINPECGVSAIAGGFKLEHISAIENQSRPPDLLVSAVDSYRCESMINAVSLAKAISAVYVGCWGAAKVGEILYVVPGKTGCYECFGSFRAKAEIPVDARKYTDPDFDDTRIPGQAGLWPNILVFCGIAFQVILGLFELREVIDYAHPLWLMNLEHENLRPMGVTFASVKPGCAVCDPSKLEELGEDLLEEPLA